MLHLERGVTGRFFVTNNDLIDDKQLPTVILIQII